MRSVIINWQLDAQSRQNRGLPQVPGHGKFWLNVPKEQVMKISLQDLTEYMIKFYTSQEL
jgi:hypothetical protein